MFDAAKDLECADGLEPSGVDRLVALLHHEIYEGVGVPVGIDDAERISPRMVNQATLTRVDAWVVALGAFGSEAAGAVPLLRRIERGARPSTRLRARAAIANTGTPDALAVLSEDLDAGGDAADFALDMLASLDRDDPKPPAVACCAQHVPRRPRLRAGGHLPHGEYVRTRLGGQRRGGHLAGSPPHASLRRLRRPLVVRDNPTRGELPRAVVTPWRRTDQRLTKSSRDAGSRSKAVIAVTIERAAAGRRGRGSPRA